MNGNKFFLIVFGACFALVLFFGIAATVLSLATEHDDSISKLALTAFRGMFTGLLGLGSGYVIGRSVEKRNGNGKASDTS